MQGRMVGRHIKFCLLSFPLFITLMIVSCGGVTNPLQPQASIPLPEEEDTGSVVVISEPNADGNVSIDGPEESLPEEVDIIIQVSDGDEDEEVDDDEFADDTDDYDDGIYGDDESDEEDATETSCSLDLPYCPQMSVGNRCRGKTNVDGSFSTTVPAQISNSVVIFYIDTASCGEVAAYESKVVSGGVSIEVNPLYSDPTPETASAKTVETVNPEPQPTYQPLSQAQTTQEQTTEVQATPEQPIIVSSQDALQSDNTNIILNPTPLPTNFENTTSGGPIIDPLLPPPITVNQPFVDLFPVFNDKYNQPLVSWIDPQGSFVAARMPNGVMTPPKRITLQGNPIYNARLAFSESHASFTANEILDSCWCLPFMKAAAIYTRLFWVRRPAPGEPVGAELFIADNYEATSPFANLPVRRVPLLAVANALGLGDVRAIRKIPFVGVTDDALLLVVGIRKPLGPMEYFLVIADRFDGLCAGITPLSVHGLFAGPDQINVNPAQRVESDGHVADYLMFFDPVTLQRWVFNLEILGLVPLPVMIN